jgi:hypothetical protein
MIFCVSSVVPAKEKQMELTATVTVSIKGNKISPERLDDLKNSLADLTLLEVEDELLEKVQGISIDWEDLKPIKEGN